MKSCSTLANDRGTRIVLTVVRSKVESLLSQSTNGSFHMFCNHCKDFAHLTIDNRSGFS